MMREAMIHGQTSAAGNATKGSTGNAVHVMPSAVSEIEAKRSALTLISAFHDACMTAATRTTTKTKRVIGDPSACFRRDGKRRLEIDIDTQRKMIGSDFVNIGTDRTDAVREHAADEAMVQPPLTHLAVDGLDMGMETRRLRGYRRRIDKAASIGSTAMIGRIADDASVFGTARLRIEIAHPDGGQRAFRFRLAVRPVALRFVVGPTPRPTVGARPPVLAKQGVDLFQPL